MYATKRVSARSWVNIFSGQDRARATAGVAAVEFALSMTLLMALLMPVIDLGMAFYQKMQVEAAAQVGAQYAAVHGWDSTAIQNAITTATALQVTAAPAPTTSCGCPTGTAVTPASCATYCPNGQLVGTYVTASAQSTYTPIVPYSLLGSSVTLQAAATVRIQ